MRKDEHCSSECGGSQSQSPCAAIPESLHSKKGEIEEGDREEGSLACRNLVTFLPAWHSGAISNMQGKAQL